MSNLAIQAYYPKYTSLNAYNSFGGRYNTAFRGDSSSVFDSDKLALQNEKKGLTTNEKWGVGLGIAGAIALTAGLLLKGRFGSPEIKQLAEHIDFSPAKTLEEAIKFGQEKLGIKSYKGFADKDLDAVNWINEGFTNVSNKMNGKLILPQKVVYDSSILSKDSLAGVVSDKGFYYGWFGVNKNIFNNLNQCIDDKLKLLDKLDILKLVSTDNNKIQFKTKIFNVEDLKPIFSDYVKFKNGKITSFKDKLQFYYDLESLINEVNIASLSPLSKIRKILKHTDVKTILEKDGILTDISQIEKLSTKEQNELLVKIWNNSKLEFKLQHKSGNVHHTIYHEMGHLQDTAKRVKSTGKFKSEKEYPRELQEWLNDEKTQQIAAEVSGYAQTGPAEFIAETFAELVSGKKLSDEVMNLYKKMYGPMVG